MVEPQLNLTFTPARTMSSVSFTSRVTTVKPATVTGVLKYCRLPKSVCKYSNLKLTAPHDPVQAAHSAPAPIAMPARVLESEKVPTGLLAVTLVPAKAAPAVP